MRKFTLFTILVFFALLVTSTEIAFAEGGIAWGLAGKPVCTALGDQKNLRMVPDGSGGAIIVWEDCRYMPPCIYAQRIDKDGNRLWSQDGMAVAVSTPAYAQSNPVIVGDGYGGAIIAWEDNRDVRPNIYALRISSDTGNPFTGWQSNGVALSQSSTNSQTSPDIASDGYGGAIITWQEYSGANYLICAQRIQSNATLSWGPVAKIASQSMQRQEFPKIISDGMGYVMITWQDFRNGSDYDIYAQRLDTSGNIASGWDFNGSTVTIASGNQKNPEIVPDGQGGAIIIWTDCRDAVTLPDIYAQWINSGGVRQWDLGGLDFEGIPVCKMDGEQVNSVIASSLIGSTIDGAIIIWEDKRKIGYNGDIYAVKVGLDESYSDLTLGAKVIATGPQVQKLPRLVSDNQGGGIGTWIENDLVSSRYQIFAQRGDQNGNLMWGPYPGVPVCEGTEMMNPQIISDGYIGAIIAWQGGVVGNYDIFVQRVMEGASTFSASISGRVTLSDGETGITGVEVWALQGEKLISSCITDTKGYYGIVGLLPGGVYLVRANWRANEIESSVSKQAFAPSHSFNFTLELDYELGTIAGNVSGAERQPKSLSASGFRNSLSSGNGTAFVELEQRGKIIVKVPLEMDGSYVIPNLLPGRFVARAYNGSIYSNSRTVNLKEGETLRVDFAFGIMPEETVYNYPNPAKGGSTTIRYYCGYPDPEAEINIYNISGELVREVRDGEIDKTRASENIYSFLWDCKNSSGKEIASGIYIYEVEVKEKGGNGNKKVVKRMAVIR